VIDDKRLYVLNLPFTTSEEEVMKAFAKYGKVDSIKMPKGPGGVFKGYAYITYNQAEEAIRAFAEMDNKIVLVKNVKLGSLFAYQTCL
jgi:multiple RNA-binding domain-containing protein 1